MIEIFQNWWTHSGTIIESYRHLNFNELHSHVQVTTPWKPNIANIAIANVYKGCLEIILLNNILGSDVKVNTN